MSPLLPAQRRAERFHSLVEGERPHADDRTTDLLELVGALRSVPQVQARPEFVADLRGRLMLAAETELVEAPAARHRDEVERLTVKPRRTRRDRRISVALGAVAIVGATTSMAVASQSALPGDALYPLKRAIENTEAGFSVGDNAKGETLFGNASERLDEVGQLSKQSEPDAQLVAQTLDTFSDQATEAGDHSLAAYEQDGNQQAIQDLHGFVQQSIDTLSDLEAVIPPQAHDALLSAAGGLFALDAAATQVCPECGTGITEVPPQLLASGTQAAEDLGNAVAGGALGGTNPSGADQDDAQLSGNGGKGDQPSGLTPPETPITIPSTPVDTGDVTDSVEDALPSVDVTTGTGNGNGGGNGGNGGKGKGTKVDLSPVTDTVNEVVNGVVTSVNEVLGGLTGTGQ